MSVCSCLCLCVNVVMNIHRSVCMCVCVRERICLDARIGLPAFALSFSFVTFK